MQENDYCLIDSKRMRKIVAIFLLLGFISCKEESAKEPKNLIDKSKMVDIIYDISLLEVISFVNPSVLDSNQISPKQFIQQKYKIDSTTFSENNLYYASDHRSYKEMIDEVAKRFEDNELKLSKEKK